MVCRVSVRREDSLPYRYVRVFLLFVGAIANPGIVWLIADILDAFTAFPNPVALLALPGTVFAATKTCVER